MNEVFMAIKSTIYWMLRGHDMRMNGVQRFTEKVTPQKGHHKI